jgi:cell division inhibitor SulA
MIFAERRLLRQIGQRQRLQILLNPRQQIAQNVRRQAAGDRG